MKYNYFFLIIILLLLIYLNRNVIIYNHLINYLDKNEAFGVIIDQKEGFKGSHLTGSFSYYYQFNFGKGINKNPSYREYYKIGDTVLVEYSVRFPFMNRIKYNPWTREEYLQMKNQIQQ